MSDEPHADVREPWGEAEASPQAVPAQSEDGEAGDAPASSAIDAPVADEGAEPDSAPDPLAAAEAQRDEYLADLQRLAADFDNYRKRALREQHVFATRASERLVTKLLPVLDDLERALAAAADHEEAKVIVGVEMTKSALAAALASEGLEEIDADGAFDPHVHEALLAQPVEGVESGAIVQVVQRGYRLGDAVLRPARVIVAE